MKTDSTADTETSNAQKVSETPGTAAHICNTSIGKLRQKIRISRPARLHNEIMSQTNTTIYWGWGFSLGVEQLSKEVQGPGLGL